MEPTVADCRRLSIYHIQSILISIDRLRPKIASFEFALAFGKGCRLRSLNQIIMWNLFQEMRLNDQSARLDNTDSTLQDTKYSLSELSYQIRKMVLVNQALYELLKEKTGISDADLRRKIKEIDLRDGTENGRLDVAPIRCPKCGNVMTAGALKCPNCDVTVAPKYPFGA